MPVATVHPSTPRGAVLILTRTEVARLRSALVLAALVAEPRHEEEALEGLTLFDRLTARPSRPLAGTVLPFAGVAS